MSHKAAAIEGIEANGLKWKFRLHGLIDEQTKQLGEFNNRIADYSDYNNDDDQVIVTRAESEPVVEELIRLLRKWLKHSGAYLSTFPDDARRTLENQLEDLEMVSDCAMEEINYEMGNLYDVFDYWRICTG